MGAVPPNASLPDPPPTEEKGSDRWPLDGEWPCQQTPIAPDAYPQLTAFMYRLLRDGASAPGDVEAHAIQARLSTEPAVYTNPHLRSYARSLIASLIPGAAEGA